MFTQHWLFQAGEDPNLSPNEMGVAKTCGGDFIAVPAGV